MLSNRIRLKPSIVLRAMVEGLRKSVGDHNFEIDMSDYGLVSSDGICYGCAATLTLAEMLGQGRSASELMLKYREEFHPEDNRAVPVHLSTLKELKDLVGENLSGLECAIDMSRLGLVSALIRYLHNFDCINFDCINFDSKSGLENKSWERRLPVDCLDFDGRWCLENRNWEEQLPIVETTIAEMEAAGY